MKKVALATVAALSLIAAAPAVQATSPDIVISASVVKQALKMFSDLEDALIAQGASSDQFDESFDELEATADAYIEVIEKLNLDVEIELP